MSELGSFHADDLAEMFVYLDELRKSGVTNMYGARPYLVDEFAMHKNAAGDVLSAWMKTFGEGTPKERAAQALQAV